MCQLQETKSRRSLDQNGSGKSTLLKALTRLIRYQKGSVILDGCDIQTMKPKSLAKKLGVLPQIHTAPSDFRVKELVGYGRMPHQKLMSGKSKEDGKDVLWAMEVTGTWKFRDKSIYEISGGETQRVWIATVLAQKPEIMFLDEPTTYLDISHQLETMNLVKNSIVRQESALSWCFTIWHRRWKSVIM